MTPRARNLLKALIEVYLEEGKPVGSRTLSKITDLKLSSATIRNVIADLEEQGFVTAPHTSAGRIPTLQGYRFFIDSLIEMKPLSEQEIHNLAASFSARHNVDELLHLASNLMSQLTNLVAVVTLPKQSNTLTLKQIELVSLSENQVLVILILDNGRLENRLIYTDRTYPTDELQKISNYLNAKLKEGNIERIQQNIAEEIEQLRLDKETLLKTIEIAKNALTEQKQETLVLSGQNNILHFEDVSDIAHLRELVHVLEEKEAILHILDRCLDAQNMQIFIGQEVGVKALDDCSVVTTPYQLNEQAIGALGVIGPTRMHYDRVIPVVNITAKLLSHALNIQNETPY